MAANFELRSGAEGSVNIIEVAGDLDFHTAPELRTAIVDLHKDGLDQIVIDMSELTFIDSSGLSVLLAAYKRLKDSGGDLALRSVPEQTRRVLDVSGLSQVLLIV